LPKLISISIASIGFVLHQNRQLLEKVERGFAPITPIRKNERSDENEK